MVARGIGIHDLRFEEKDAEIFKIADTKTRLDTLQNYFFPRLEVLLQDTVALAQDIYSINAYERMTVTSRPRHRKEARQNLDYGEVHIGLRGKWRRAGSISEIASVLTYTVYPEGSLQVLFKPFVQKVNEAFSPNAISDAMPIWRLALESPCYCFPLDGRTFPILEGAFAVLYPLLEACIAVAEGEPPRLSERIDTFKRWYIEALKTDEAELDDAPPSQAEAEPDLPTLDSYAIIRPGIWWAVLARDQWTCCSCGRSTRQDGVLLEVDQILPRSRGGTDELANLQTLCKKCNIGKSNRDDTDLRRAQRVHRE